MSLDVDNMIHFRSDLNNPEGGMCDPPMFMDSFTIPWSDRRRKLEFKRLSWSELQDLSHLDPPIIVKENT